jgi:hypothetical protein
MQSNISIQILQYLDKLPPKLQEEVLAFIKHLFKEKAEVKAKEETPEVKPQPKTSTPVTRLRGVISLPEDFDYKDFLGNEILESYLRQ